MLPHPGADLALNAARYEQSLLRYWLGRVRRPQTVEAEIVAQLVRFAAEPRLGARQRLWFRIALEDLSRRLGPAGMKLASIRLIEVGVLPPTILARGREELN